MTRGSDLDVQGPMPCGCYRVEVADFGHDPSKCRLAPRPGRHGNPALDPPGTCRWRNPRDSGPWIKVTENRWVHVGGGGGQEDGDVARWPVGSLGAPAWVDWPARFRAAADAADEHGRPSVAQHFRWLAAAIEHPPPDVAEAIERALRGERL